MKDQSRTNQALIQEQASLKNKIKELEQAESSRKRAEEELHVSEERFRLLSEAAFEAIAIHQDGVLLHANAQYFKMFGYEPGEALGKEMISVTTAPESLAVVKKQIATDGLGPYEAIGLRKDGTRFPMELRARKMEYKGHTVRFGAIRDITERKQVEEALQESEEKYRSVVETTRDMIYATDRKGFLTYINPTLEKTLGYTKDEWNGKSFAQQIVAPECNDKARDIFRRAMQGEFIPVYEIDLIRKDGTRLSVEVNVSTIYDHEGNPVGRYGIGRDITERKQVEKALKESEEKYRSVVETTRDMIYATDRKGFLTYINPTLEKTLGYTKDEWNGKSFAQIVAPEYIDKARDIFRRSMHGESIPVYEIDLIRKDGTRISVEVNVSTIYDQEGKPAGRYGIGRDITERKQVEKALKESEAKYRNLLENASDAILLADTQGNIVEANRKAEELWGYAKDELLQMHYTQLHPVSEMERTIAAFQEIIEKNSGHLSGGFIQKKDGDIVPVDITCNVIESAGRKVAQASFRDISEHKITKDTLEELVRERTAELSEKNNQLVEEIKERKRAEAALRKKTNELLRHSRKLEELNAALKVLLKQREEDKADLEEKVLANVKHLLSPQLDKLKKRKFDSQSKVHLDILESNLNNIVSSFSHKLSSNLINLTPTEIKVANLIREGKTTKEIAEFLGSSASSINIHRFHIRRKLGLIGKETNLESYLTSLS